MSAFIDKIIFNLIYEKYSSNIGVELPLLFVNNKGEVVYSHQQCSLCQTIGVYNDIKSVCKTQMVKIVEESLRWGGVYISTCPMGLFLFSIPVVHKRELTGGFISGFVILPGMHNDMYEEIIRNLKKYNIKSFHKQIKIEFRVIKPKDIRRYTNILLRITKKYDLTENEFLIEQRKKYIQQFSIANFIENIKEEHEDVSQKILDKQDEIIEKVRLGDKVGAREILNEFLGYIFFESNMKFEVLKVRLIELIVIISRAAIEEGINSRELLGLNYSYLTELNMVNNIEDLCFKVTNILENFINKVSRYKGKKKSITMTKIEQYINQNFTNKIKINDIAEIAVLSPSRVIHLFKEEKGISLTEYIKRMRIQFSKYLLINTEMSISEIGNEVGFFDQSHFTREFKSEEHITPLRFRKKYSKL